MRTVSWAVVVIAAATALSQAAEDNMEKCLQAYRQQVLAPAAMTSRQRTDPPVQLASIASWDRPVPLLSVEADDASEPAQPYTTWQLRSGPAYPDRPWHSVGRDLKELPSTLWDDTKTTFTNPKVLIGLLAAGAAGIAINATGVDDTVADRTDGHRQLSTTQDGIGGFFGSPAVHFPLAAAMYATGLLREDTKLYETSKTLMNALIINGLTTQTLKWATRTESPNGDELGWPSGHTSSSFVVATVMYEAYGPWIGVPLFAFAGFVGYERIDARNHDFSDVVSGAIIGIAIAHSVANNHQAKLFGMDLLPFADPATGTIGLALTKTW
ncbi:MAG: phosphatase PAP2 family protein [Planctomycetes bacterium]|nr:phosphatase PAP2 family protein [Planctomycetota bacterium]